MLKKVTQKNGSDKQLVLRDVNDLMEKERRKLVEALNKSGDMKNVTDLFDKPTTVSSFTPIVVSIHIPKALQKYNEYEMPQSERVEDFTIIYDGFLLIVAAECLNLRPTGVFDARDRFEEVLKSVITFETAAPCLTHQAITYFNKGTLISQGFNDLCLEKNSSDTLLDITRTLYLGIGYDMRTFYECCHTTAMIDKTVAAIYENQSLMLSKIELFIDTDWKSIRRRRTIVRDSKKAILSNLKKISQYSVSAMSLEESRRDVQERMKHNKIFGEFINRIDLDEYTKPQIQFDVQSSIRIIEYVRGELDVYSTNNSTTLSALLGAVIGSILTIIVARIIEII